MLQTMLEHGLNVESLILDGEIHRVRVNGKKEKNGWYVGREVGDKIFGTFGRWDTGVTVKWSSTEKITQHDREIMEFVRLKAEADKERKNANAAKAANAMWSTATAPDDDHPYLLKKKINPILARQYNEYLLIPMYLNGDDVVNLQKIYPDGSKRFLYGGIVKGASARLHSRYCPENTICLCEGYATGVTIYEATSFSTIVCFNAGNMAAVAIRVREKFPTAVIYVCCDNDPVGIEKGTEAARVCDGEVRIPNIKDGDFNDLCNKFDSWKVAHTINMPSAASTKDDVIDLTTTIPPAALNVPGLITDGLNACLASELPGIMQYNYPVVLSMIARAISGKVSHENRHPVFYNLKVGGTSTGKTHSSKIMLQAVCRAGIEGFYGPSEFASGPGLLRSLEEQKICLINMDEASYLFKRFDKPDQISSGKIAAILELYTATGTVYHKVYADKRQNIKIDNPCVNIVGNATPGIFEDIRPEDFDTGLLQRWDFWYYGGPILHRQKRQENGAMDKFINGLKAIMELEVGLGIGPVEYEWEDEGKRLHEYSRHVVDECNKLDEDSMKGLISRSYDNAIKYAMIHAASVRTPAELLDPLTLADLEYGILLAELLAYWKKDVLAGRVHQGTFHKNCEMLKDGIRAAHKVGVESPTIKKIMTRRRPLRNLSPKELDDIERALIARGELYIDTSRGKRTYHLIKTQ